MIASIRCRSQFGKTPGRVRRCERDTRCQAPGRPERSGALGRQSPCRPPAACPVPAGWPGPPQHGHDGLAFADQFGVGQPEPRHGPVGGGDQQQPAAPVEAVVRGVVAIAGPAGQARAGGGRPRAATHHRGAIQQPQQLGGGWGMAGQPAPGSLHQLGASAQPTVAGGLGQQPGEQMPDPGGRGPQPVVLVVAAQQDLGHGQADQLGVGDVGVSTGPTAPPAQSCRDDPVGQLHIQCDKKSVQVGDHRRPQRSKVCRHADLGHSSPFPHPLQPSARQTASTI
jgi:hypothetical protein